MLPLAVKVEPVGLLIRLWSCEVKALFASIAKRVYAIFGDDSVADLEGKRLELY